MICSWCTEWWLDGWLPHSVCNLATVGVKGSCKWPTINYQILNCLWGSSAKVFEVYKLLYSGKFWQGKTLVDLGNGTPFANILPSQIPDSLK